MTLPADRPVVRPRRWCRRESLAALAGLGLLAAGAGRTQTPASALPDIVARTKPAVLPVGTFNPTDSPRFSFRGSGFVIAEENGRGNLLATNFHVLPEGAGGDSGPPMAVLSGPGGAGAESQRRLARVVATDRLHDLALLQIEGPALPGLTLDAAGQVREGQSVALMGFPIGGALGFSVVTHRGIVASITSAVMPAPTARQLDPRAVSRLREGNFELLQLDATAYPGNSGGPTLDAETGRVIGIVSMVLVKGGRESALSSPTGITYAVPVAKLLALMQRR